MDVPLTRLFAVGLWLAATVGSTAVVWTATSVVAADVTDRPASVLAHDDVVSEVESGLPVAEARPASTTTSARIPSTSTIPGVQGTVPTSPSPPAAAPPLPPGLQPAETNAPATTTTVPDVLADLRPSSPAAPQPAPRPTATYSTSGGVVRVACNGLFIELISAIPNSGYETDVVSGGPANVDVRFVGSGQDESVKAVCFRQPIRYYEQGRSPRQAPGSER